MPPSIAEARLRDDIGLLEAKSVSFGLTILSLTFHHSKFGMNIQSLYIILHLHFLESALLDNMQIDDAATTIVYSRTLFHATDNGMPACHALNRVKKYPPFRNRVRFGDTEIVCCFGYTSRDDTVMIHHEALLYYWSCLGYMPITLLRSAIDQGIGVCP